jgi:hypothetical protein
MSGFLPFYTSPETAMGKDREKTGRYRERQLFSKQDSSNPGNKNKNWQKELYQVKT